MIPATADTLRKGDVIQFTPNGNAYTVQTSHIHSFEHALRVLTFAEESGPGSVTMPQDATVYAVEQWRVFAQTCFLCKSPHDVKYNMASGGTPRGIICEDCDTRTTAEVLRRMREDAS